MGSIGCSEMPSDFIASDDDGNIPLHLAAESGELNLVKYFIEEKGADSNSSNRNGNTPLHNAAQHGELNSLKFLKKKLLISYKIKLINIIHMSF